MPSTSDQDALYLNDGDQVVPTRLTVGPWSPDNQHGGAPSALLAGAIERVPADSEMMLARISVEILRPVPLCPMRLGVEVTRPGKKVQLIESTLFEDETPIVHAVGLRLRRADLDLPFEPQPSTAWPHPDHTPPSDHFPNPGAFGEEAMETRSVEGDFNVPGPAKIWFRLTVPVLEGHDTSPVENAVAAADFGNGVSNLDPNLSWLFINPDLNVRFARPPEGEWVLLDSVSHLYATGTGLAESALYDLTGRFGRSTQSLLVEPRS